ncbi:UDP-N-acetylmuramate dehydrogenase [Desulfolucanica intricata]|uniref:UDP-N-acetylmuramate dehydrogenase n=1 Tax=Desulfolucanica intricata TaxID=1285191 RepID=UPI000831E02E|nr:UDP-N-acetylmuramate dehydrogenase [Desulfolucanica intricata]
MNKKAVSFGLEDILAGKIRYNEPMSKHTSWRIGGPAELLVEPQGLTDLQLAIHYAGIKKMPVTIIGNGTNLLVSDSGIKGMVIKIGSGLAGIKVKDFTITVGAGAKLARVASTAQQAGLGGLEFMAGIPGTLGGAIVMNAGANGSTISDFLQDIIVVDDHGEVISMKKEEVSFGYRTSSLQELPFIVVEATLKCFSRDSQEIKDRIKTLWEKRKASQPLDYPNAGSVFRNPPGDSAGRLIETAGGKALRVGDAQVSEKHANFIVNLGRATAVDVLSLISKVQDLVYNKHGIELSPEVRVLGDVFRRR